MLIAVHSMMHRLLGRILTICFFSALTTENIQQCRAHFAGDTIWSNLYVCPGFWLNRIRRTSIVSRMSNLFWQLLHLPFVVSSFFLSLSLSLAISFSLPLYVRSLPHRSGCVVLLQRPFIVNFYSRRIHHSRFRHHALRLLSLLSCVRTCISMPVSAFISRVLTE